MLRSFNTSLALIQSRCRTDRLYSIVWVCGGRCFKSNRILFFSQLCTKRKSRPDTLSCSPDLLTLLQSRTSLRSSRHCSVLKKFKCFSFYLRINNQRAREYYGLVSSNMDRLCRLLYSISWDLRDRASCRRCRRVYASLNKKHWDYNSERRPGVLRRSK